MLLIPVSFAWWLSNFALYIVGPDKKQFIPEPYKINLIMVKHSFCCDLCAFGIVVRILLCNIDIFHERLYVANKLYHYVWGNSSSFVSFPGDSMVNNLPVKAGDLGLIPERGRSAGGGTGNPLGKSRGQRSLMGYSPWGYKELDMTEHAQACHARQKAHRHQHGGS